MTASKPMHKRPRTFCNNNIFIKPDWASRSILLRFLQYARPNLQLREL